MRKEHPILYSTPMVVAKLEGRKTQTRRIIKESFNGCLTNGGPHPCPNDPIVYYPGEQYIDPTDPSDNRKITIDYPEVRADFFCSTLNSTAKCPYGKAGDWLWGRHNWFPAAINGNRVLLAMSPDNSDDTWEIETDDIDFYWKKMRLGKIIPSIFMPKETSRIWEEILDIRVERLQDITEEDAIAEGIQPLLASGMQLATQGRLYKHYTEYQVGIFGTGLRPVESYATLWESINGPGSWEINPWIWVITTKILSITGRP